MTKSITIALGGLGAAALLLFRRPTKPAPLVTDTERLNYLEQKEIKAKLAIQSFTGGSPSAPFMVLSLKGQVCRADTFREAIDQAIQQDKEAA